jgi:hypothetical protein
VGLFGFNDATFLSEHRSLLMTNQPAMCVSHIDLPGHQTTTMLAEADTVCQLGISLFFVMFERPLELPHLLHFSGL